MTELKYCKSCGEKSRLTWPKYDPECCTQRCAANAWHTIAEASGEWEGTYCPGCGTMSSLGCECFGGE